MEIDDVCLQCGMHVPNGRPYCSGECESLDSTTSPAISTASSALSSPQLGALNGARAQALADVPALLPSALGAALRYDRYVPGRYIDLDDEDEVSTRVHPDSSAFADKLSAHLRPLATLGKMSYARRPSGTNQRSTVPTVHTAMTSSSASGSVRSSSTRTTPSEADDEFDFASSSLDTARRSALLRLQPTSKGRPAPAEVHVPSLPGAPTTATTTPLQKKRNRASLPAYFQLLAVSPNSRGSSALPSRPRVSPPISTPLSASIDTPTASRAPPSPVDTLLRRDQSALSINSGAQTRGRGRRREVGESSASRERPRERSQPPRRRVAHRYEADESEPEAFPVSVSPVLRGRRRGPGGRDSAIAEEPRRGRRTELELDGEHSSYAPALGNGRSGLRGRPHSPSREHGRGRVLAH